jgi:hypothetical protein
MILCGNQSGKMRAQGSWDGDEILNSGERASHSGLYRVYHESQATDREIFILKGTELPVCENCGKEIKFKLMEKIPHIGEDPDFC